MVITSLRTTNRMFAKYFEDFSAKRDEPVLSEGDAKQKYIRGARVPI